jgi:hypothetical protein
MKSVLTTLTAALIATSFAVSAEAAAKKSAAVAQKETACKAEAAKKYSVVRFMARRDYVQRCMGELATKPKAKSKVRA